MSTPSDEVTNNEFHELDAHYKSITRPNCPKCKSNADVIPCVIGRPTKTLSKYAEAGHVRLMGCCPISNENNEHLVAICKKCETQIFEKQQLS